MLKPKLNLHGFIIPNAATLPPFTVAGVLDCSREHISHLIHHGELDANNSSSYSRPLWNISRTALIDFINERTTVGKVGTPAVDLKGLHACLPDRCIMDAQVVADFLQCSRSHVINLIQCRKITATDIAVRGRGNRKWFRISKDSLAAFIASNMEGAY